MFKTFDSAHSEAVKQNLAHGRAIHIYVVIQNIPCAPESLKIKHEVVGYNLSVWRDETTVHSVVK